MISKRELVRKPSLVTHLKAGEAMEVQDKGGNLIISRPKRRRLSAEQIEADLQRLSAEDPAMDVQAVLNDLRS